MTTKQLEVERRSIDWYVTTTVERLRPVGTNAAVTLVLIAAVDAAARAAARDSAGAIVVDQADRILSDAIKLMHRGAK